jgi:hypothetical protein
MIATRMAKLHREDALKKGDDHPVADLSATGISQPEAAKLLNARSQAGEAIDPRPMRGQI